MSIVFRDLDSLAEYADVVELERRIWGPGYDDVVPVSILAVTSKSGGILIGAFDAAGKMVGFVYSIAGIKDRKPMQWSHMLGVVDEHRQSGLGRELKLLQRERALALGVDLIEWTYDPMQAANAHLNFAKLGVVVAEYEENVYGESASPLHRGNPTDRFIAEWWIRTPHVERRIASTSSIALKPNELAAVPAANALTTASEWPECGSIDLAIDARRVAVQIPMGFTEMLSRAPDLALAWRMATRQIFTAYFGRRFRAVDFHLDRANRRGTYVLARN